jgi:uncharacterized protein YidB (DUF937 family)
MSIRTMWATLPRAARIYLAAVGGVAVAGLATVITVAAASPSPSPSPSASPGNGTGQAYCNRFIGHVASNLGKTQDQVKKALTDALDQTLNDAVKNGDLTQKQADAIKSRFGNSSQVCSAPVGRGVFPGGIFPGGRFGGKFGRFGGASLSEYAKALGISQSELQQDLQSGKTVKDVAAAKGMDESAFRSKLAAVVKSDLDQQVKNGNLTQNQENAVLQRIQSGPLPLWDQAPRRGLPGDHRPNPSPVPSAKTTSTSL